jgi:hypothetical protein
LSAKAGLFRFEALVFLVAFWTEKKGLPYQALLDSTQAASTLLLGILYPYPKHTHIAAKGMRKVCERYAKGMRKIAFPIEPF